MKSFVFEDQKLEITKHSKGIPLHALEDVCIKKKELRPNEYLLDNGILIEQIDGSIQGKTTLNKTTLKTSLKNNK